MAAVQLQSLETKLDEIFVKKAPALPANAVQALVKYLPYINLALGLLTLYTAYVLWHWAHVANGLIDYANRLSQAYGGDAVAVDRMGVTIWLALVVLVVEALIYIAAYTPTKDRKKSGWDLMFYAALVNLVYGVVTLFTDYGGVSGLVGTLIGSTIGLYLLFQIRSSYLGAPASKAPAKKQTTKKA